MAPPLLNNEQIAQVKEVVSRVLGSWVGYQLALKNNAAGGQTSQLNEMLHQELNLLFVEHANIEKFDIEDWLNDAFDEQFNLRLEDGSVEEMSQIRKQTPAGVPAILGRLPSAAQTTARTQQTTVKLESESEDESGEEEMAT